MRTAIKKPLTVDNRDLEDYVEYLTERVNALMQRVKELEQCETLRYPHELRARYKKKHIHL